MDDVRTALKPLPRRGHSPDDIIDALESLHGDDVDWKDGRVWSLVFHAGEAHTELLKRAYTTYFAENALNPTAFPSLRKLEAEVVAMTAHLLGGNTETVGSMTTGGTESILMAVKAAREWGRAQRPRIDKPEMVLPSSAHPAFEKASHYFGIKAVHVPVGGDFRADVSGMERAITRNTVLIVGSAPSYPQGVIDPIEELAALAGKRGILCHVDACVGGYMLPFVRELGRDIPPFDLSVPGVTSMSCDLHKYGYAAKGASVVLYHHNDLRLHAFYAYTDWPGGIYISPSMTGTRSGGAIAAAWAALQHLGFEGYVEIVGEVMEAVDRLKEGIASIPRIHVLGDPKGSVLSIGSDEVDIYEVGDNMTERGWHLDRQQNPPSLHLTVNKAHVDGIERFLDDLRLSARVEPVQPMERFKEKARNVLMGAAVKILPASVVSKATQVASTALGVGDGELPTRTAAMYGLMASLPNRGDLETMVIELLGKMHRYDPSEEIQVGPQETASEPAEADMPAEAAEPAEADMPAEAAEADMPAEPAEDESETEVEQAEAESAEAERDASSDAAAPREAAEAEGEGAQSDSAPAEDEKNSDQ